MEVFEVTRSAYEQLVERLAVTEAELESLRGRDALMLYMWASFGKMPSLYHIYSYFGTRCYHDDMTTLEGCISCATELERMNDSAVMWGYETHVRVYEVWHVVDDEPTDEPTDEPALAEGAAGIYQRDYLVDMLGEYAKDFDLDAIERAVTGFDEWGNRRWLLLDDDEFWDVVRDSPQPEETYCSPEPAPDSSPTPSVDALGLFWQLRDSYDVSMLTDLLFVGPDDDGPLRWANPEREYIAACFTIAERVA